MNQVKFALRIKEARKEKGWTQKELAEKLQISDKAVSKWERAKSMPDIELLGPISRELEIPLAELLDVEELTVNGQEDHVEALLQRLLPLMKEKVHQEIQKRKRLLSVLIILCVVFATVITLYPQIYYHFRETKYEESKQILSFEELTINRIDHVSDSVLIDITTPLELNSGGMYSAFWRDKENPEIAYFYYFYYEKPWLIYDSLEEYEESELNGKVEHEPIVFDMPVSKIIYVDTKEHVVWEN